MAQQNVGFDILGPQAIDRSYGALSAGRNVPYVSAAAAIAAVPITSRYRGKTVSIDDGTGMVEWWWRVGTADAQLVPKITGIQKIEFIVGGTVIGAPTAPADSATSYTQVILQNCTILDIGGDLGLLSSIPRDAQGFQYYQYDPVAGRISLFNAAFNSPNWWFIKYIQK